MFVASMCNILLNEQHLTGEIIKSELYLLNSIQQLKLPFAVKHEHGSTSHSSERAKNANATQTSLNEP